MKTGVGSVLTWSFCSNPLSQIFQFLQCVYVQIYVAVSVGVGDPPLPLPPLHYAIKFNDTSTCLNHLKWLSFFTGEIKRERAKVEGPRCHISPHVTQFNERQCSFGDSFIPEESVIQLRCRSRKRKGWCKGGKSVWRWQWKRKFYCCWTSFIWLWLSIRARLCKTKRY